MSKKKYSFYSPTPLSLALAAVFSGIYCNSGTVSAASYDVSGWEEIASHRTENDVHLNVTADLDGSYFKNKTKEIVIDQVKMTIDGQGHHVTFPERDIDEVLTATNGGNLTIRNLAFFGENGSDSTSSSYLLTSTSNSSITLDHTTIRNIRSIHPGSVLMIQSGSSGSILDSVIEDSHSSYTGVVSMDTLTSSPGNSLTVARSHFRNNSGTYYGGAIFSDGGSGDANRAEITESHFTGNNSQQGGAVYAQYTDTDIVKSVFTDNTARSEAQNSFALGGAITSKKGTLSLQDSVFTGNTASSPYAAYGGAIYNTGELLIHNGTFRENISRNAVYNRGGALYNTGTALLSGTNIFSGNTAGDKPNDITNQGTLDFGNSQVIHEKTFIGSGIDGNGELNLNSGILEIAENRTVEQGTAVFAGGTETRVTVNDNHIVKAAYAASATDVEDGDIMNAYRRGGYTVFGNSLTIRDGAKLTVAGANANKTYLIAVSNNLTDEGNGWKNGNLIDSSNVLLDFRRVEGDTETGTVMVTSRARDAREVLPCVDIPDNLNALVSGQKIDVDSSTAGIRFLSRATDSQYMPGSRTQMEEVINSAAQIATAGAVRNITYSGAGMFNRAVEKHLSLSRTLQLGDAVRLHEKEHADLWVDLIGMHQRNHGMPVCSGKECGDRTRFGHRIDMGGIVAGIDRSFDANRHAGIALMAGTGSASSKGDFSHTKNDVDFWGASLYGGYDRDNWNVMGNVSYTHFDSDIDQTLPATLQMGNRLRADISSHQWSAGIRGEYRIRFDNGFDLLPHAGLRYDRLVMSGFRTKADAGSAFSTKKDTMNIYSLPVGAGIQGTFRNRNGWTFTPQADLTAIFAAGDIRDRTEVSAAGLDATDSIHTRIVDRTSIMAGIGFDMQKGNKSFGLHYDAMYSSRQMWQGLMAKVVLRSE